MATGSYPSLPHVVQMDSWEAIRSLDEEENWLERNRVLSKSDHMMLLDCAKVMIVYVLPMTVKGRGKALVYICPLMFLTGDP